MWYDSQWNTWDYLSEKSTMGITSLNFSIFGGYKSIYIFGHIAYSCSKLNFVNFRPDLRFTLGF